jgi:hypothetical protein
MIDDNNSNDNDNDNDIKPMKIEKAKKSKPCRFYFKPSGCRSGENCIYSHDNINTTITTTNNNDSNNDMEIDELTNMFQKNMTIPKISFGRKNRHFGFKNT